MRRAIILLIALATCPAAVAQTSGASLRPNQDAKKVREVESLDRRLNEAFMSYDDAVLDELLAEDWSGPAPLDSMAEKTVALENFRKLRRVKAVGKSLHDRAINIYDVKVRLYGGTATVTGRYTFKAASGPFQPVVQYLNVFVKRRGRWQAVSSLLDVTTTPRVKEGAPLRPPQAPPCEPYR
jgi:hypothetical protein